MRERLVAGGACSTANWSEVAQKVRAVGADWDLVRGLLLAHGLQLQPVTAQDAERAAARWHRGSGLSLADRLCLALGERLDAEVLTADAAWRTEPRVVLIRD